MPRPLFKDVGFNIHKLRSVLLQLLSSLDSSQFGWKFVVDFSKCLLICFVVMLISIKQFLTLNCFILFLLLSFLKKYAKNSCSFSSTTLCQYLKLITKESGIQLPIDSGQYFFIFLYNLSLLVNQDSPSRQLQMTVSQLFNLLMSGRRQSLECLQFRNGFYFWLMDCSQQIWAAYLFEVSRNENFEVKIYLRSQWLLPFVKQISFLLSLLSLSFCFFSFYLVYNLSLSISAVSSDSNPFFQYLLSQLFKDTAKPFLNLCSDRFLWRRVILCSYTIFSLFSCSVSSSLIYERWVGLSDTFLPFLKCFSSHAAMSYCREGARISLSCLLSFVLWRICLQT